MTVVTIIINKAPYGEELAWNALRLAQALLAKGVRVNIFLLGDGVFAAKKGQTTPHGYYNLEQMLEDLAERGAKIGACGTCAAARGLEETMVSGVKMSGMIDLATWIKESQHILTF
ncbi:MAG: DsrE family protein [Candidatus Hadarchaeota archaeon]